MTVQRISAVTLAVRDMSRSVEFYQGILELPMLYGGLDADFTSFRLGEGYLNLIIAHIRCGQWVMTNYYCRSCEFEIIQNPIILIDKTYQKFLHKQAQ